MVDATKHNNNMMVSSINKIHITSLEIEKQHTQTQKKFQNKSTTSCPKMMKSVITNIQKNMVQAMF